MSEQSSETERDGGAPLGARVVLSPDRRSFRVERHGREAIVATEEEDKRTWGVTGGASFCLRPRPAGAVPGFCLFASPDAECNHQAEIASTSRVAGATHAGVAVNLVLSDGRVFWIDRGAGAGEYELSGWEVPGAYWRASPTGDEWELQPTPAGARLGENEELTVLFVAEILEREVWGTSS